MSNTYGFDFHHVALVCRELALNPLDYADQDPDIIFPVLALFARAELFGIRYRGDLTERFGLDQLPTWESEGWGDTSAKTDHPTP